MYAVKGLDHVNVKVDALTHNIENLIITLPATVATINPLYEICGVQWHVTSDCQLLTGPSQDQANYTQGNPFSNTYNLRFRNHPNFYYKNNNAFFAPRPPPPTPPDF